MREVIIVDVRFVYLRQLMINYNHVPKFTVFLGQYRAGYNCSRSKLTMDSLDLCVGRKSILAKLAADATLFVATEWDSEVGVL
jgi:hypothetical protein